MKLKSVLVARFVTFAAILIWVLGFLGVAVMFFPLFMENIGIRPSIVATAISIWYLTTVVSIGILVTTKGFNVVGKWESSKKTKKDDNTTSK